MFFPRWVSLRIQSRSTGHSRVDEDKAHHEDSLSEELNALEEAVATILLSSSRFCIDFEHFNDFLVAIPHSHLCDAGNFGNLSLSLSFIKHY